jgi:hypothetical protein
MTKTGPDADVSVSGPVTAPLKVRPSSRRAAELVAYCLQQPDRVALAPE